MENRRIINHKLILGGALLGAFLLPFLALGYSQNTTHPALTDEIVDFYNASFPDNKITYEEKLWLIKGSVDEDDGGRFFSHFYDPVYDRGLQSVVTAGVPTISSKKWALGDTQKNFYNSQMTGYAAISGADSIYDFSYDRALKDYAMGDKQRAFIAFGHVLHLLEDAGVPDHTRNDPHPPVLDLGSPYEHEMDKWNPENFQIARTLFLTREKPVVLPDIGSYLDRVANYSNNNFFSKDTINNEIYLGPSTNNMEKLRLAGKENYFVVGTNPRDNREFPLAFIKTKIVEGKIKVLDRSLVNNEIKTYILDGYWERLSKEVVVSGAGALKLFLEEAEIARREYLAKAETKKPSFWAQIAGLFGFGGKDNDKLATSEGLGTSGVDEDELTTSDVGATSGANDELTTSEGRGTSDVNGDSGDRTDDMNGDKKVSPSPSPILSPKVSPSPTPVDNLNQDGRININMANKAELDTLPGIGEVKAQAIVDYRTTNGQFQKIEDIMNVSGIGQATFNNIKDQITVGDIIPTPTPTPVTSYGGGGGGGGSSSPSVTPTATPTPTPTPELTTSDGETTSDVTTANSGDVIINEIAWMGTATSSNDEWLELHNTTSQSINITGWTLKSLAGPSFDPDITLSGTIPADGYFLLERTDDTTILNITADQIYTGSLLNSGESLELKDTAGNLIDSIDGSIGWPAGDNSTKETAQKVENNWVTASPTPKAANSANPTAQAPSAITNLAATHGSPTITATWTAPDPGTYSSASLSYDLRYSSIIFTEAASASWWSAATKVASASLPSVAEVGAQQSASFDVVPEYSLMLYFALRTKVINLTTCEVVNGETVDKCSEISNVAAVSFDSAIDDGAWGMFGKDQYHTSLATVAGPGIDATVSWEFDAAVEFESGYNVSQPVADADGNIYFGAANGSSGKIVKLDKNGVQQWDEPYETNVSIGAPAVLSDGTVYFGRVGAGGFLAFTALNPDGSNKWNYSDASTIQSFTVSPKGEPHFTYTSGMDKLGVLNTDGSIKTSFPISASGLAGFAPVVLDDGTIIVAKRISGNQFFNAYSVDGNQLWPAELFYTGANGNVPSDPSYDKSTGKTYSAAGPKLFNILSDGSTINVDNIAPWDYSAATMVAIAADTLYIGFNSPSSVYGSRVFALNKSNLTKKWSFQADGLLNKQLAVDKDGNVYLSTQNGKLYSIDSTGNQRWVINSSQNSRISPILTEHGLIWGYGSKAALIND